MNKDFISKNENLNPYKHVAIVTGAASGIGEATAKMLAAEGAAVVVADIDEAGGTRVVTEIETKGGIACFRRTDSSLASEADALVAYTVDKYGKLTWAVNNAAISLAPMLLDKVPNEAWQKMMSVDLNGVFYGLCAQLHQLVACGGGAIVNVVSVSGIKPLPGLAPYVAAKHAVVGLTRQAALEYIDMGIRVNAVAPGLTATSKFNAMPEDNRTAFAARQPGGRAATPEDIANAIVFLLSDKASYINGDILMVDNGSSLRSPK
jgi:NAD(P)-dependent dehydrogenase (short-subunit alcohol dehydrogenase family)